MPCMCWYDPPEHYKKAIKEHCVVIIKMIKELEREGDPYDCTLNDVKKLMDHLYDPKLCEEEKYDQH